MPITERTPQRIRLGQGIFSFDVDANTFLQSETAKHQALQAANAQVLSAQITADAQRTSTPSYFERMEAQDDANEFAHEQLDLQERQLRLAEQAQAFAQRPQRPFSVIDIADQRGQLFRQAIAHEPKSRQSFANHVLQSLTSNPALGPQIADFLKVDPKGLSPLGYSPQMPKLIAEEQKKRLIILKSLLNEKLSGKEIIGSSSSGDEGASLKDIASTIIGSTTTDQVISSLSGPARINDQLQTIEQTKDAQAAAQGLRAYAEMAKTSVDF